MDLIFSLLILAFFGWGELLVCHSKLLSFGFGIVLKNPWFVTCYDMFEKIFVIFMHSRRSRHTFLWFSFCLLVRFFGTIFAQIFRMPNSSVRMSWMVWWFKFNLLPIILTVKHWSYLMRALILVTFSSVFDVQGLPERGLSATLSRPSKNALCHLKNLRPK